MKTISLVSMLILCAVVLHAAGPKKYGMPQVPMSFSFSTPTAVAASLAAVDAGFDERTPESMETMFEGKENKSDPAYALYKDGYGRILDEQWESAHKVFAQVISGYPRSEYLDDASYWSAYAMKNIDRKKAIKEYKDFIAKFPKSNYFDDAVADLSQLSKRSRSGSSSWSGFAPGNSFAYSYSTSSDSGDENSPTIISTRPLRVRPGAVNTPSVPKMYKADASMRRLNRELTRMGHSVRIPRMTGRLVTPKAFGLFPSTVDDDTLDEKTRIKMDALRALGGTKEDSISFKTLRDVATNTKQSRALRMTALDELSEFRKFDVLPTFIHIAKTDPDEEIQNTAIDVISNLSGDKNRSVETLIELYRSLPKEKKEQRETVFYTIADIGNDKAVDFLADVAKNGENIELREEAIDYLGNIGGEKAREALYSILGDNKSEK